MRNKFKLWVENIRNELDDIFITTEYIKQKNPDESLIPNPSTGIIHESQSCLGQVTVWESRQMTS